MESNSYLKPTVALPCGSHSMQWINKAPYVAGYAICNDCKVDIRDYTNWKAHCLDCKNDLCDRCAAKKYGGKSGVLPLGSLLSGITATGKPCAQSETCDQVLKSARTKYCTDVVANSVTLDLTFKQSVPI